MKPAALLAATLLVLASSLHAADGDSKEWVEPMKKVHANFTGAKGTFAQFGDSITVTLAYWAPVQGGPKNMDADTTKAFDAVKKHMKPECWRDWRGDGYGSQSGQTIRWAHTNVDAWLKKHNPETALVMFGTNDLNGIDAKEYEQKTREVVEKCLKNGTVVILSTIPPRSGVVDKSKKFAEIVRQIGKDLKVPVIDYQAEILKRRPEDWDGTLAKFKEFKDVYQVPTLIAGDGVHPSNPQKFNDFSEESLKSNGYQLRNYLTLRGYADVVRDVLQAGKPK
ncbi:MAG: SGNH/GDSL hydrolase family protein [Gemmataceae bacterium]|nr:SGNH/GDSL hydrolase family protein [Gemmataceae bacterium]